MPYQKRTPSESSRIVLFAETKNKTATGPTMRGSLELHIDDLKWAIAEAKAGKEVKFKLSLWKKTPKAGGAAFLSGECQPDVPYQKAEQSGVPGLDDVGDTSSDFTL